MLDPQEFNGAEKQPEKTPEWRWKAAKKLQNGAGKSESFVTYEYGPGTPKKNNSTSTCPPSFLFEG